MGISGKINYIKHIKKRFNRTSLHTAAVPAVLAAVKIELSYLNDIMVIAFFFLANTNKDNAKVALATSNS